MIIQILLSVPFYILRLRSVVFKSSYKLIPTLEPNLPKKFKPVSFNWLS